MKTKKVGTTVFLTPYQRKALARLQEKRGDSMGHLVQESINLLLDRYAKGTK